MLRDGVLYLGADNRFVITPADEWRVGAALHLQAPTAGSAVRWAYEEETGTLRALNLELCLRVVDGAAVLGACEGDGAQRVEFLAQWF
jgi:hypothetical protein